MTAPTLRPLSLGEVLDVSFGLYRAKFGPLIVVTVASQIIPSMFRVYFGSTGELMINLPLLLAYYLLAIVLSSIGIAASTRIVADAYLGRETSAGAALGSAASLLGRIVAVSVTSSLLIVVGFLLLIVPGFILMSGLMLGTVVTVLETPASTVAALGRSWELSKGYRVKVLATLFCVFVMLMVPTVVVGALWAVLGSFAGGSGGLAMQILSTVLALFIYPFFYTVITVLYYDLRVRKEGFDLELLASQLLPG
jgi:hypothetical protein